MVIRTAKYISSSASIRQCPPPDKPEFAFTGRSNVGKSSLINMLAGRNKLAKTSQTPGKTRTINHFLINDEWYLVDLPGYGYARTSSGARKQWQAKTLNYLLKRENLVSLFVLIDIRIKPQSSDLKFMEMLGINGIPFFRVFTKSDKISRDKIMPVVKQYNKVMEETWEEVPGYFISSSVTKAGRNEILEFIQQSVNNYGKVL